MPACSMTQERFAMNQSTASAQLHPRRARRVRATLPISVHRAKHSLLGRTLNVSRNGLLFEVAEPLREHEFCIMSVHRGQGVSDVELAGHVIRSVAEPDSLHTYALRLHGHEASHQHAWEDLLRSIFEIHHTPGALHLSPSEEMLLAMHHSLVHREPLWVPLGRPAPLHTAFSLIIHHPVSQARFDLPVTASANQHGCTLLTLSASASPLIPHQIMRFISSLPSVLHS
jgi:hypothetical protein